MKTMFLTIAALISTAASASQSQEISSFSIENARFAPAHVARPGSGELQVNYSEKKITLEVQKLMPPCPAGMACIQVMPEPLQVELPIKSVEVDSCGGRTVVAETDQRPADGMLSQITVQDVRFHTCPTLVPIQSTAQYLTSYYDMLNGKSVTHTSIMELKVSNPVVPGVEFTLKEGKLLKGSSPTEVINWGSLKLSEQEVELQFGYTINCKGPVCPMYLPMPIYAKLPVVSVKKSFCGDVIKARLVTQSPEQKVIEVKVTDYRQATCEIVLKHLVHVEYQEKSTRYHTEKKALLFF